MYHLLDAHKCESLTLTLTTDELQVGYKLK